MEILQKQILQSTEGKLMSSQEVFRASHTALQEKGSVKKTNATCGRTCLGQYEKLSQSTWWGKMFGGLLVGTGDWYSTRCKLTWKLKVTPSSRAYFQLAVSTLPIDENEFGLLPTVQAGDGTRGGQIVEGKTVTRPSGQTFSTNLVDLGKSGLLPTPDCSDRRSANSKQQGLSNVIKGLLLPPTTKEVVQDLEAFQKRMEKYPNGTKMPNLATQVNSLLPTPRVSGTESYDSRAARKGHDVAMSYLESNIEFQVKNGMLPTPAAADGFKTTSNSSQKNLNMLAPVGTSSQLNPRFVGEMMGFPVNWTELPFLSGEAKVSKPTETPSYLL